MADLLLLLGLCTTALARKHEQNAVKQKEEEASRGASSS